jgi:hypothetical protein
MLKPLLIIGVGGSGGKTIRALIQSLQRKMVSAGYDGKIPDAWQFLQIDTTRDGHEFPAPMLDVDSFHQVVPNGQNFTGMLRSITDKGNVMEQQNMLSGWGVPFAAVNINMGAGQIRAIGRQAGIADSAGTLKAIQGAIAKMSSPTAFGELVNFGKAFDHADPDPNPQAIIIASVAGGSGAGMFLDVAELLKRSTDAAWANEAVSFLYTAEVFSSVGNGAKDTAKNSLGAFNELMAGKWVSLSDRSEFLYQKLGLAPVGQDDNGQIGCKGNIFIGCRNDGGADVSVGPDSTGMNEVFLTIGEALAGVFTDKTTAEYLFKQAFVNVTNTRSSLDVSGLAPLTSKSPTLTGAGLGFGQLTLGADRVVDYVADAMTRAQVERLLFPDMNPELLKNGVTNQSLILEKVNQMWDNFLIDSKLDEKGSQNQILDQLFPADWSNKVRAFTKGVARKDVSDKAASLQVYGKAVSTVWKDESKDFLDEIKRDIEDNAQKWVPMIQDHLREQVAKHVSEFGFSVVIKLLERLKVELSDFSQGELLRESKEKAEAVWDPNPVALQKFMQENAEGVSSVSLANTKFLDTIDKALAKSLAYRVISHVNQIGASLIQDIVRNLIDPVIKSLGDARYELDKQVASNELPDGSKNPYNDFPKWGSGGVPSHYLPRQIERTLIDKTEYESTYLLYASRDSQGLPPFQVSVTTSLIGKKLNPKDGDPNNQNLVEEKLPWITGVREANPMGSMVSKATWEMKTTLIELSDRNKRWLKHRDSAFGKFTNMPIRDFLEDSSLDPQIRDAREKKFVAEFQAMLALSKPLVQLNQNALKYIKFAGTTTNVDGFQKRTTKLPFSPGSSLGKACISVLAANGEDPNSPNFTQDWFNPTANYKSLQAVSTNIASLPAWAFSSLTEPILNQVAVSKNNAQTWMQFWEGRRARPLIESVPFETEMRRSIITGWFIASLFGLRDITAHANGRSVKVWNPTLANPGWSSFPDPLLDTHPEDASRGNWMLPAILKSAGLALCQLGKTGDVSNIEAYKLLLFLGREVTTSLPNRDKWNIPGSGDELPTGNVEMSEYIRNWVINGVKPSDKELLSMLALRLSPDNNRGQAIKLTVNELREQYSSAWEDFKNTVWHKMPETWELKDDIDSALEDIQSYVDGLSTVTAVTGA